MKEKMKTLKKKICAAGMVIAAAGISVPAVVGALPVEDSGLEQSPRLSR